MYTMDTGGPVDLHNRDTKADADQIRKNKRLAALCGNCRPDRDLDLDVCCAPSQDRRVSKPSFKMARVCGNDRSRVRLCNPRLPEIMAQAEVLGTFRFLYGGAFGSGCVCSCKS